MQGASKEQREMKEMGDTRVDVRVTARVNPNGVEE